jgi:curved DNA-binding protein CbpA
VSPSDSQTDQEIFRVRAELEAAEGPGISFYDFIGVKPGASIEDINTSYKKRSRVLHPDKVKQQLNKEAKAKGGKAASKKEINAETKKASERFTRLGLVNRILQDERRDRYDHFLSNGFPKWRDTGYYYERYRPGLGSVLIGLFVFGGGFIHWILLSSTWKRNQEFMERYITRARREAWGDNLGISSSIGSGVSTPPVTTDDGEPMQAINRRQRRMQEKDSKKNKPEKKTKSSKGAKGSPVDTPPVGAVGPKKRVVAENGKILIVDQVGNVYLEGEDEDGVKQEYFLDVSSNACH